MNIKECNHKWKPISTINYASYSEDNDKEFWNNTFLQDKTFECQECFIRKVVTRACRVSAIGKGINYKAKRIPDWICNTEGSYVNHITGTAYGVNSIFNQRHLDYPDYPDIDWRDLLIDGKTLMLQNIIE